MGRLLILSAILLCSFVPDTVSANQRTNQTDVRKHPPGPMGANGKPQLPVSIQLISKVPGLFMFDMETLHYVSINFTLRCEHPSTVYSIMAKSLNSRVAKIEGNPFFNISCSDKISAHGVDHQENNAMDKMSKDTTDSTAGSFYTVTGEKNMTIKADMIGRSFLMFFANKIAGPSSNKSSTLSKKPHYSSVTNHPTSGNMDAKYELAKANGSDPGEKSSTGNTMGPRGGGGPHGMKGMPPNMAGRGVVIVMRFPTTMDHVFRVILYVVVITATIGMGVKIDLQVVKEVLKKPISPIIGLFCQYVCMPLIAYLVANVVPQPSVSIQLGIFVCGIVPGGGASNIYCYLLGGDISLSVTMTTISCLVSLGLIPFWLYTLGQVFTDDLGTETQIPFPKIIETLAIVLLPLFVGIFLKYKLPRATKIISKILKPFLVIVVCFLLGVGIYVNYYIFSMIRPMQVLAGCLLPYFGYFLGGLIAFLTRRPWKVVKTIAIETGIQNIGIAFFILFFSLPPPDNQLAVVAPAASAIMTPLPLLVITICYTIYQRRKNKKGNQDEGSSDEDDGTALKKLPSGNGKSANDPEPELGFLERMWLRFTHSSTNRETHSENGSRSRSNGLLDDEKKVDRESEIV